MTDRRRSQWIRQDVDLITSDLGDGILEQFGAPGMVAWVAFQLACKRSPVQGQIRYGSEADCLAQLGLVGIRLRNEHDEEWTLDELWTYLARFKHVSRRRSRRTTDVIWTRFAENQESARRDSQAEQKARSRAIITETEPGQTGAVSRPDKTGQDRDKDRTEPLAPAVADALPVEVLPIASKPEPKKPRARDLVWDALMAACSIDSADVTDSKRGAYGKAVKDLRRVARGRSDAELATEIERRAGNYVRRWGAEKLTPTALVAHWAEVNAAPKNGIAKNADDVAAWLASKTKEPT